MKYKVEWRETYSFVAAIEADSPEEAQEHASLITEGILIDSLLASVPNIHGYMESGDIVICTEIE